MLLLRTNSPHKAYGQTGSALPFTKADSSLNTEKTNQGAQILPICLTFNESLILAHQDVKQEKKLHFLVQCSNSTCNVISRIIQMIEVINANIWKDWELDNSPEELPRFSWTMEELEFRKCSYQARGWMYIFPKKGVNVVPNELRFSSWLHSLLTATNM